MCPTFNTGNCSASSMPALQLAMIICTASKISYSGIYIPQTCRENTHIFAMPSNSSTTVDRTLEYTMEAATGLQEIAGSTHIPFLERTCTLALTIVPMMQNTKFQKERCLRIAEDIHHLLCVLTSLCINSEDIQSPNMLYRIAQYAVTLQKVDSCLRAQRDLGTIKRLFKQNELVTQLDICETELKAVIKDFEMQQGVNIASGLAHLNSDTERRHQGLLELISTWSGSLDGVSSVIFFNVL
ncbi:hypothetical protein DFH08DRAFT_313640 [Mycena albidolilacea]|uniref:Uncharacterized protein n=1 Tax=Mycena albidolilacea TaxID=1033008 RepID=A0AAD7EJW0_9AGAR|nr:hypothetical protein DFH08DRAFT_313640 [Mycena albidolilacea]